MKIHKTHAFFNHLSHAASNLVRRATPHSSEPVNRKERKERKDSRHMSAIRDIRGLVLGVLGCSLTTSAVGVSGNHTPASLFGSKQSVTTGNGSSAGTGPAWAKVIDQSRCIGCHACTTACKSENQVPLSVTRTYVKYVDIGTFPHVRRAYQVTRCNQCENAPCARACPTGAMFKWSNGIVDFDKSRCIGCKACIAACPYDAIFINPEDHCAEKCNLCAHRLDSGLEPACAVVCPVEAIMVGDLNDPTSKVAQVIQRDTVTVRKPEKGTKPRLFYKGAHQATLDPLAARRPEGGIFMWSEQKQGGQYVVSGHPTASNSTAPAVVSYDVAHKAPWDWRVSFYTWTKGIAAGAYLVPLILVASGQMKPSSMFWKWIGPMFAGVALAKTGAVLIIELEHPERFYFLYSKPQRESWLVKGAMIISGYTAVLSGHMLATMLRLDDSVQKLLMVAGVPASVLTSIYTGYLFAQSKARDLWQNPLLIPHLLIQTLIAGSASLLPLAPLIDPKVGKPLRWMLSLSNLAHILCIFGEATLPHPTAHARLAAWEMVHGRYKKYFTTGVGLALLGALAPLIGGAAAPPSLAGLLAYEHAYVQAGQSVPLA